MSSLPVISLAIFYFFSCLKCFSSNLGFIDGQTTVGKQNESLISFYYINTKYTLLTDLKGIFMVGNMEQSLLLKGKISNNVISSFFIFI